MTLNEKMEAPEDGVDNVDGLAAEHLPQSSEPASDLDVENAKAVVELEGDEKESMLEKDEKVEESPEKVNKWNAMRTLAGVTEIYDTKDLTFPESTHTLLFTADIVSIPFALSVCVAALSVTCLALVLVNNPALSDGTDDNKLAVPVNVGQGVRAAQYAIIVALLMEEEIPQAIVLLKTISKGSFKRAYPDLSFFRFLSSVFLRFLIGYMFLINVYLVIVQADNVIEIFYDILALQFVQQLDDVTYSLAQRDLMGKTLFIAANREFTIKPEVDTRFHRRLKYFLFKALFFLNAVILFLGVVAINTRQENGKYLCDEIFVTFGDQVWQNDALVTNEDGDVEKRTLVYSYFNGVYRRDGYVDGYPRYVEQNKVDGSPFESTVPAEIRYCENVDSWVFTHPNILKVESSMEAEFQCQWLLKSEETNEYDILEVSPQWSVWVGITMDGNEVSFSCNDCDRDSDCNYHGVCSEESQCECNEGFFGHHCQHSESCSEISGEIENDPIPFVRASSSNGWVTSYEFPVYALPESYISGNITYGNSTNSTSTFNSTNFTYTYDYNYDDDGEVYTGDDVIYSYIYSDIYSDEDFDGESTILTGVVTFSGSRWFVSLAKSRNGTLLDFDSEYHAFWRKLYEARTIALSDPTTKASPVGVDFYERVDVGPNYGPFGLLKPFAELEGAGWLQCANVTNSIAPA